MSAIVDAGPCVVAPALCAYPSLGARRRDPMSLDPRAYGRLHRSEVVVVVRSPIELVTHALEHGGPS